MLLGVALQTRPGEKAPLEQIGALKTGAVRQATASWAGRWILLSRERLQMDAAGLLGCFYRSIDRGDLAGLWISSSPSLLADLNGLALKEFSPPLTRGKGMDWYPPPASRTKGIRRLLPTEAIALNQLESPLVHDSRLALATSRQHSYVETLDFLEGRLLSALRDLSERLGGELWVALTGGMDSRVVLAAALRADIPFKTFTLTFSSTSTGDKVIPPLLADASGVEHHFTARHTFSPERADLYDRHCAGHSVSLDRDALAEGQWETLGANPVVLGGGVFEVGRNYYHRKLPKLEPDSQEELVRVVAQAFEFERLYMGSEAHWQGVRDWAHSFLEHRWRDVDWRDQFYYEQRLGGWMTSLEQGLDAAELTSLHIANSEDVIGTLLHVRAEGRARGRHQIDLIDRMAPRLLDYPFNPRAGLRGRARAELRALRSHPRKLGYVMGFGRRVGAKVR